jgi:hypothetical protein
MSDWLRWCVWVVRKCIVLAVFHVPVVLFGYVRPRTYVRSLRVRRTIDGSALIPNGLFAIYAIRPESNDCPFWIADMLHALQRAAVNVCIVSNCDLSPSQIEFFKKAAYRIIVRDGSGRDFGSYKDAILELFARSDVRRLLLLNDSVYVFSSRIAKMLSALMTESDAVIATNENIEIHYHLQSFAISIPKAVLEDFRFRVFWRRFLPLTDRRYVITRGEVGLTKQLFKINPKVQILYNVTLLEQRIKPLGSIFWCDPRALPIRHRDLIPTGAGTGREFSPSSNQIAAAICEGIVRSSQVHSGAFYFLAYLDAAILKRDIVFRREFRLNEVPAILNSLGLLERNQEILQDLRRRSDRTALTFIQKQKYDYGLL